MEYFTITTVSELLCLSIGTFCIRKERSPAWWIFYAFILLTCFVELTGIYMRGVKIPNTPMYNLYLIPECLVISFCFYNLYQQYMDTRKWFVVWIAVFTICYLTENLSPGFSGFAARTVTMMSIAFVLASLYYYYLILKHPDFQHLASYAPFWWVNGTLLYYFGSTAINIFFDYFLSENLNVHYSIRYHILKVLNMFLYACWSYSFICRYLQRKLST